MFYTDSFDSPIVWKMAKKGIVVSATNFTWIDCGSPSRPAPSEVLSRLYVAGIGDDTDGDGLGSAYELLVLHTNPDLSHTDNSVLPDGEADFDNDGYSNLQEYNLGTDPLDPASFPATVPRNLVARWKLDEGTGTFIADSSANGLDGVITVDTNGTTPTWTGNGILTNSLFFNGSGTGYVLIPSSNCLSSITTGLTVSAWVLIPFSNPSGTIISKCLGDGTRYSFTLGVGQGTATFGVGVSKTSCIDGLNGDVTCSTNRQIVAVNTIMPNDAWWHLVTGTFSGSANSTVNIYVDGIYQTNRLCSDFDHVDHITAPLLLGLSSGIDTRPFAGTINDVRIYNRVLSSQEIAVLYFTNTPPRRTYAEFALWSMTNGAIYFKGGEVFNGRVHADDEMYFYVAGGGPVFNALVTSRAGRFSVSGGSINDVTFNAGYNFNCYQGSMGDVDFNSPSSNSLKNVASSGGLVLDGASTITFNGSTLSIINTRMGWSTPHIYIPPAEGIIYIKNSNTGSTSTRAGKTFLMGGLVTGRLTVVTEDDIYIRGNITYGTDPTLNPSSTDALGLIAYSDIWVDTTAPSNLVIQAAVMATGISSTAGDGSFGVINYNSGSPRGTLTVYGGIVQLIRGAVGTFNSGTGQTVTGYLKNYSYDPRMLLYPPPYYPVILNQTIVSNAFTLSQEMNAAAQQTALPSIVKVAGMRKDDPAVGQSMDHVQMENLRRMVRENKLPKAFGRLTLDQIDEMEKDGTLIQ
jgi:hypothetical protein